MSKSLITLLLAIFLAGPAWPQETAPAGDAEEPQSTETDVAAETSDSGNAGEVGDTAGIDDVDDVAKPEIVDPDFDDTELDEQTYEEDEDDFVPSEEIPADEPIPFPSNI